MYNLKKKKKNKKITKNITSQWQKMSNENVIISTMLSTVIFWHFCQFAKQRHIFLQFVTINSTKEIGNNNHFKRRIGS